MHFGYNNLSHSSCARWKKSSSLHWEGNEEKNCSVFVRMLLRAFPVIYFNQSCEMFEELVPLRLGTYLEKLCLPINLFVIIGIFHKSSMEPFTDYLISLKVRQSWFKFSMAAFYRFFFFI